MNILLPVRPIVYPDSDGMPRADNTRQLDWITLLYGNLRVHFRERAHEVFVGANQLWYPVEGEPDICVAPDVYVVFGRPQGHRGAYKQWEEADLPITVASEILSPSNDYKEVIDKQNFYEDFGVTEYLLYDPESNVFEVHLRRGEMLRPVRPKPEVYTSERLGVRFDNSGEELRVFFPDGRPFQTAEESEERALQAERLLNQERTARRRLAELGRKARHGEATPEELAELERLENASGAD